MQEEYPLVGFGYSPECIDRFDVIECTICLDKSMSREAVVMRNDLGASKEKYECKID